MEMEFTLEPPGIGLESRLVWDITRQMEGKWWDDGVELPDWTKTFPAKDEEPNDDSVNLDEDNTPNEDKIYVRDTPGFESDVASANRSVYRYNFREFVRVRIGGQFTNNNGLIEGSRCSHRVAWRSRMDVTRNAATGKWQRNGADNKIMLGHEAIGGPP
jgi:hypothetical protein